MTPRGITVTVYASAVAAAIVTSALYGAAISVGGDTGREHAVRLRLPPLSIDPPDSVLAEAGSATEVPSPVETAAEAGPVTAAIALNQEVAEPDRELWLAHSSLDPLTGISFDLAAYDPTSGDAQTAGAFEISKRVSVNGASAGRALIQIRGASTIAMARDEVARLIALPSRPQQPEAGLDILDKEWFTFDDLRAIGIDVRYDPIADRLLVTT